MKVNFEVVKMIIKNKTNQFQKCGLVLARPWRVITVPDGTEFDKEIFELIGEKKKIKKTNNKGDKKWL